MRWLLAAALLLSAGLAGAAGPQRVVSLNLCTDQLLLELLPRDRIAMLSTIAADPLVSFHAAEADGIPRYDGRVESLVQANPDIVLAGAYAAREGRAVLERLGYRVETLDMPETVAGSLEFITRVGALTGTAQRAADLRAHTERRLQAVRQRAWPAERPLALVYLPNGLSPGRGTLKNELLELAGWRNLAAERGIEGHGTLSLEDVITARPAIVLYDAVDLAHASIARQTLTHPALRTRIAAAAVPSTLWICGSAQVAAAAEFLAGLHGSSAR